MRYAVYLPLLFPLLAALAARPLGERLPPRLATWMLTAGAVLLATASTAVLTMLTITGLLRIPLLARLAHGHWSAQAAQQHDPASLSVALIAGVLLAAAAATAARLVWRRTRALLHAAAEAACLPGRDQLVVLDDPAAEAYAIPGRPGRIVVSTGMLTALDPAECEILLAHERSHLANRHHLFVAAAQLAAAANPLLRPLSSTVDYTLERWADEDAAAHAGDRRRAAHAVGKAALASKHTRGRAWIPAGALGILGRLAPAGPGPVPRRVAALMAPPPRGRTVLAAVLAGLLLASGLCAAEAAHDLEALLELAKHAAAHG